MVLVLYDIRIERVVCGQTTIGNRQPRQSACAMIKTRKRNKKDKINQQPQRFLFFRYPYTVTRTFARAHSHTLTEQLIIIFNNIFVIAFIISINAYICMYVCIEMYERFIPNNRS